MVFYKCHYFCIIGKPIENEKSTFILVFEKKNDKKMNGF